MSGAQPPRVTVVGSLNMDLVVRAPRIPSPGETILGGPFETAPGGKGANQAAAAARMEAVVRMVGRVGDDAFGAQVRAALTAAGVECSAVLPTPGVATGVGLIVVEEETGQNAIVVASGANAMLAPEDVRAVRHLLADCDVLVLQFENPVETVMEAARLARAHGASIVLNPAPARAVDDELLAVVDLLVPNEAEAGLLAGVAIGCIRDAEEAARILHRRGAKEVVITLGNKGALIHSGCGTELMRAFPVRAVDATAAGDAFVGSLAVLVAEGWPLRDAVVWANAAGALAVTERGAMPSLPSRAAVEDLVSRSRP